MELNYSMVFNAAYYANHYEDLRKAYGYDKDKLLEHFITHGMKEGREGCSLFNIYYYKNKYPDLKAAFGDDLEKYYIHYINNGYKEKRIACGLREKYNLTTVYNGMDFAPVYDGLYYVELYPDLKNAFGYNGEKLISHFVNNGMVEGREAKPTFKLDCYKDNYPDLRKAFGDVNRSYYLHYIAHGEKENRVAGVFLNPPWEKIYKSETGNIEIVKDFYNGVNVYAAHLIFTNYKRFRTFYHPSANTSKAAELNGAVFCVNGSAAKLNNYGELHDGVVPDFCKNYICTAALYNNKTGMMIPGWGTSYGDMKLVDIAAKGIATDSFGFGSALIRNGEIKVGKGGTLRPRTFIGTNEKPGDIWIAVAEGDRINGNGGGLNYYDCAVYLKNKGCTLAYPLDGGGSSTMWFQGHLVNTPSEKGKERGFIGDFIYFK